MSTEKMISTVIHKPIFHRFAQISDEQKTEIVEKVKQKLQEKANGGAPEAEGEPSDSPAEGQESTEEGAPEAPKKELPPPEELNSILDGVMNDAPSAKSKETEAVEESEETSGALDVEAIGKDTPQEGADESGDMSSMVEELAGEVENIRKDGQVTPTEVMGLFDNMMQMVTLLINSKSPSTPRRKKKSSIDEEKIVKALVYDKIAERIASRGNQSQHKDKDLMKDTGGISKGRNREPEQKPPRSDSTVRYRTKRTTEHDTDTENNNDKDKEAS